MIRKKKYKAINARHLSEKTLENYIRTRIDVQKQILTLPKYGMPKHVYLLSDGNVTCLQNLNTKLIGNKPFSDDQPKLPQDLVDLINWMTKNKIECLELRAWGDVDWYTRAEWREIFTTETFLPFYDTDTILNACTDKTQERGKLK